MTVVSQSFTGGQTATVLVPAIPGKIIRVLRVLFTTWGTINCGLSSDPGGPTQVLLSGAIYLNPGVPLDVFLGRAYAWRVARGKALGFDSAFSGGEQPHSVTVWYDVTD